MTLATLMTGQRLRERARDGDREREKERDDDDDDDDDDCRRLRPSGSSLETAV